MISLSKTVEPWQQCSDHSHVHCAERLCDGEQVAFVDLRPRVKHPDTGEWIVGPNGVACDGSAKRQHAYGFFPPSREWADNKLQELGYVLLDKPTAKMKVHRFVLFDAEANCMIDIGGRDELDHRPMLPLNIPTRFNVPFARQCVLETWAATARHGARVPLQITDKGETLDCIICLHVATVPVPLVSTPDV